MSNAFIVRAADWNLDETAIAAVRRTVFIDEQGVPEAMEWESCDSQCRWLVAVAPDQRVIGIVRLTDAGRIGRMAVLPTWRRRGAGWKLLEAALGLAAELGFAQVHLSAQMHAIGFYAQRGFVVDGGIYLDAGIPHRSMTLKLKEKE